jgi:hypothetical protein
MKHGAAEDSDFCGGGAGVDGEHSVRNFRHADSSKGRTSVREAWAVRGEADHRAGTEGQSGRVRSLTGRFPFRELFKRAVTKCAGSPH